MNKRESIEWCDIWVTGADADALPRVLLVGDSITGSYFAQVEKSLAGKFLCARSATSICICASSFKKELSLVLDEYRFAVIHFNNGLHGWDYDEDAYAKSFPRILDFIARRSRGSKLIWASSTPVRRKGALNEFAAETTGCGSGIASPLSMRLREASRSMISSLWWKVIRSITARMPFTSIRRVWRSWAGRLRDASA